MHLKDLLYQKENGFALITLDRPKVLNAISPEMLESLAKALEDAEKDARVRVLALTGSGRAFSAGADINALKDFDLEQFKAFLGLLNGVSRVLWNLTKPSIAALNGVAVGGGFEIALLCDIRIAARGARLGSGEVRINQPMTNAASLLLPKLIGEARARELSLTGRLVGAEEAERIGLVSSVAETEHLMQAVRSLAEQLSRGAPIAMAEVKRCLSRTYDLDTAFRVEGEAAMRCFASKDQKEGLAAFLEKRPPRWTGE